MIVPVNAVAELGLHLAVLVCCCHGLVEAVQDGVGVGCGADEEASGLERLCRVPHHALRLLGALEAVVEGELAADQVELGVGPRVQVFEPLPGAVGGEEVGAEPAVSVSVQSSRTKKAGHQ